jgi:hypothetical protein
MSVFTRRRVPQVLVSGAVVLAVSSLTVVGASASGDARQSGATARIPVVRVTVTSTAINGPTRLRPGITTFHTTSTHPGTDSLAVVRLDRGTTYPQIFRYLVAGNIRAVFAHVSGKGGIAHGGPHNRHEWTANLTFGRYLFVDDEANLVAPFRVAGPRQHAPRPDAKGTIVFPRGGGKFRLPACFGSGTWRLYNKDTIHHELGFLHITGGHSRADVLRAINHGRQPSWVRPVGTVNLIGTGESAWVTLRHISGLYLIADYLPAFQGLANGPIIRFRYLH